MIRSFKDSITENIYHGISSKKTRKFSYDVINEIVRGKRGITPETAWLFSNAFGNSPEFWLNLQAQYDLATSKPKKPVPLLATG